MPAYAGPEISARISPALKKRMQGKSCFNFTKPDPKLFAELEKLTEAGVDAFARNGWL